MNAGSRAGAAVAVAVAVAGVAVGQEAKSPPPDPAAVARRDSLAAKLPAPMREAIAAREDRDAVLDGTTPLRRWVVHAPPFEPPKTPVGGVAFSADARLLLAVGSDGTARAWQVVTGVDAGRIGDGKTGIHTAAFAPKGDEIASVGADYTARLWDGPGGREKRRFEGHRDAVYGVVFAPDGKRLATAGLDGTARIWDCATGKAQFTCAGWSLALRAAAWSEDGKTIATAGDSDVVQLWDPTTGKETGRLGAPVGGEAGTGAGETGGGETAERRTDAWALAFAPDSRGLAAAFADGSVRVWDAVARRETARATAHAGGAYAVAWGPGGTLVSAGADRRVRLWRPTAGALVALRDVDPGGGPVFGVACASKLPLLATVACDGSVGLWALPEALAVPRVGK